LGVESVPGEGSVFWVQLSEARGPADFQKRINSEAISAGLESDPGQTILYIEDNLSNLKLVEQILTRRPGFKLMSAMQGGLGVDLAREHHPELILLDVNLPDMGGGEVLRQLQKDPRTVSIPVVVVSADAMMGQIERFMTAGARAYLTKPIDVHRFLEVLDQCLRPAPDGRVKLQQQEPPTLAA
jgi:CheY-like chemotaxis protein